MKQYHKIQTVYLRDPEKKFKTLLEGQFSKPEFKYLKDNIWVFTEKVDGTNIRVMWNGEGVVFGGKSENAQISAFLVNRLNELFEGTVKRKLFKDKFGDEGNVCLYGEGYGAKIQKGGGNYISDGQDFVLFDVKVGDWWLERKDVEDVANYFGIKVVPIIGEGTLYEMIEMTKRGFNSMWGDFRAEGIVARPKTELKNRGGERVITKVKSKDFDKVLEGK